LGITFRNGKGIGVAYGHIELEEEPITKKHSVEAVRIYELNMKP
jgi:hypothetical protein